MHLLAVFPFLFIGVVLVSADLGKSSLWPNGLGDSGFSFGDKLPVHSSTTANVDVPDQCTTYAAQTNSDGSAYCGGTMSAISVTYDDCSEPWTFCRCDNAQNSFDTMVSQFGRLPVNLRDYVRYVISFSGLESAFSSAGDMVLFGDESTEQGLTVLIHESGHDIDQGTSTGSGWTDALNEDSCATDPYGNTSAQEEFAQVTVVSLYTDLFGGAPNNDDTSCISNQLGVFSGDSRLNGDAMSLGTCDQSVRDGVTKTKTKKLDVASIPKPSSTAIAKRRVRSRIEGRN